LGIQGHSTLLMLTFLRSLSPVLVMIRSIMGVGTGGAEGAAAPPTFGTGEHAIALAPPKV